jgi:preprotein translocase subunit SecE
VTPSDADLPPELADAEPTDAERTDGEPAPAELETAGVAAGTRGTGRPAARKAPVPKGTPTAKRDVEDAEKRTTPVAFVQQSVGELRKVVYPTGQQLGNYFVVVLVFVLFIIALVSLLDLGIGKLVFAIFS